MLKGHIYGLIQSSSFFAFFLHFVVSCFCFLVWQTFAHADGLILILKDSVGLNNNSCSSKITFTSHAAEKVEKPVASSSQQQPAVTANKDVDTILGSADCSIVPKIDAGFASTITSAADTVKPPPPMPDLHSSSLFNKSTLKEQLFKTTFGSKSTEKGPSFTFCPTRSSTNGTSGTIFVDSKTEIFNRSVIFLDRSCLLKNFLLPTANVGVIVWGDMMALS